MKHYFFLLVLASILITACSHEKNGEKPIARVFDKYLYPADLAGVIPANTSKDDSIKLIKAFINEWMQNQVLIVNAEENIDLDKKELDKKINDYRESILIYEYENELVRQKLDTTVTQKQVEDYYNQNKDDFILHNDIFKGTFAKIKIDNPELVNLKRMLNEPSGNLAQLNDLCKKTAEQFSFDESNWISTEIFPTNLQNKINKNSINLEQKDSLYEYFIQVKEFVAKDNLAPVDFAKEQIVKTILNRRKVLMIKKTREGLINEAVGKSEFEVFNN